jgi:hypothetical protein
MNETTSKSPLYLAFKIEDLEKCSEEDIKSIEKHLDSNSYLLGYEPSTLDRGHSQTTLTSLWLFLNTYPRCHFLPYKH